MAYEAGETLRSVVSRSLCECRMTKFRKATLATLSALGGREDLMAALKKAIQELRLRLHSGLRQRGRGAWVLLCPRPSPPSVPKALAGGPVRPRLGYVAPLALRA
jgi:hypothetical protein